MWDEGKMTVLLSQTKLAKITIFVGAKNDAIAAVEDLLTRETQWYDYMEEVICFITTNFDEEEPPERIVMTHST